MLCHAEYFNVSSVFCEQKKPIIIALDSTRSSIVSRSSIVMIVFIVWVVVVVIDRKVMQLEESSEEWSKRQTISATRNEM